MYEQQAYKKAAEHPSLKREHQLKNDIDKNTEYNMLMDRTIKSDKIVMKPDGIVEIEGYVVPVEHDGAIHGVGEGAWETKKTREKMDNYIKLGYFPVIVNVEWLKANGIEQSTYLQCAFFSLAQWLRAKRRMG